MAASCSIVLITAPDPKTADFITATLLEDKLAACVNQVAGVKSSYWWEGKLQQSEEILLIVKTRKTLVQALVKVVLKNHPYSVPEAISFPITDGNKAYLAWIEKNTATKAPAKK